MSRVKSQVDLLNQDRLTNLLQKSKHFLGMEVEDDTEQKDTFLAN